MSLSKLRKPRRRDPLDEVLCWKGVFRCGWDYFDELAPLNLKLNPKNAKTIREAAREPWKRLGRLYIAEVFKPDSNRPVPWALDEFGEPD